MRTVLAAFVVLVVVTIGVQALPATQFATTLSPVPAPMPPPPTPSPPGKPTDGPMVTQQLQKSYAVQSIRAGTIDEQADRIANFNGGLNVAQVKAELLRLGWKSWTPTPSSPMWQTMLTAFNKHAAKFKWKPVVSKIYFYEVHYLVESKSPVKLRASADHVALFGAGIMNVFHGTETAGGWMPYPVGRSTTGDGAMLKAIPGQGSVEFIFLHELTHAHVEARPKQGGWNLGDFKILAAWNPAGNELYDGGSKTVQTFPGTTGLKMPANMKITAENWNSPKWIEQPFSKYALAHSVEDFAESGAAWVMYPEILKARSPGRFDLFENMLS